MSISRFRSSPLIDEIVFRRVDGGSLRAYLHAGPEADPKQLHTITQTLSAEGHSCIPMHLDGKPMLEVRGFSSETKVIDEAFKQGWVKGGFDRVEEREDKPSFADKLRKRSLLASSVTYLVGDFNFLLYGRKEGSKLNMAAGAAYAAGTLSSLLFGHRDPSELQIKDIANRVTDHVRKQNLTIEKDSALDSVTSNRHQGPLGKANEFLQQYPSNLLNLNFALAGAFVALAAYKTHVKGLPKPEKILQEITKLQAKGTSLTGVALEQGALAQVQKHMKREGWMDVGLGTLTLASGLFGTLVTEKAIDPDAPKKEGAERLWQLVQAHPLTVAGVGYMAATLCHAGSTAYAMMNGGQERKGALLNRGVFIATNIIAELLLAISSKGHGEGVKSDHTVEDSILAVAGDLIAKQPRAMQEQLVPYVAKFLGHKEALGLKDNEAITKLQHAVELVRSNPWAQRPAELAPQIATNENAKSPSWQAKTAQGTALSGQTARA